nr:MAG TPA: hypothetical protein [Caudoviricetes sp.]
MGIVRPRRRHPACETALLLSRLWMMIRLRAARSLPRMRFIM